MWGYEIGYPRFMTIESDVQNDNNGLKIRQKIDAYLLHSQRANTHIKIG